MDHPHHPGRDGLRRVMTLKWGLRLAIALIAIGFGFLYMREISPTPWWRTAGLDSDPGDFIRKLTISYPICRPWQADKMGTGLAADAHAKLLHVTRGMTAVPVTVGDPQSIGFRLPGTATVLRAYCGVSVKGGPVRECSPQACSAPVRAVVTDDLYTRGRTLVFTMKNRGSARAPRPRVTLWLVWKVRLSRPS
jgi:hypothetical protein